MLYTVLLLLTLIADSLRCDAFRFGKIANYELKTRLSAFGGLDFFTQSRKASKVDVETVKQEIKDLARGTKNGIQASEEVRESIKRLVSELESANTNSKLTTSRLMDGDWNLVYTTNEGSSAGKLGPFVGDVVQSVDLDQGDYINFVRLPGFEGALTASWDVLPKNKWRVKFEQIRFSIFGIKVVEKPLGAIGTWRFTYLDDDLRILYAAGGENTVKENIYILAK